MTVRPVREIVKRIETGIFFQVLLGMLLISLLPLAGFWWLNTRQAECDLSATIETILGQSAAGLVARVDG